MRVSIFGMGYVGAVCSACLASRGHQVIGVDISDKKVALINSGKSPIVESGLEALISEGVNKGALESTTDTEFAVINSDLTMICVGTPSKKNGDLELEYIENVCRNIGAILREKSQWHTVVVRSTVLPGTVKSVIIPILEDCSRKIAGEDFGVTVNPEFLRESTAIFDYDNPPMTVIGEVNSKSGEHLKDLYSDLPAEIIRVSIDEAELIKYACNAWHATKITFANEIGNIAKASGTDGRKVMKVLCKDAKLNLSSYYMKPGFAFGGSCLPKDVRALNCQSQRCNTLSPLLNSLLVSNTYQIDRALNLILDKPYRSVGLLGLSFKAGTDDLRESPLVRLAEMLIGKGIRLRIYDKNVEYARVYGANKEYIVEKIPHVSSLLCEDLEEVVKTSEILIIGNNEKCFTHLPELVDDSTCIIDLVGIPVDFSSKDYQGICW